MFDGITLLIPPIDASPKKKVRRRSKPKSATARKKPNKPGKPWYL